jgi:hypothetical protein
VYEVQYFVKGDPETGRSVLMRRYCPVVPGVSVGEDVRPGGTLAPLAEHIAALYVRCYNGTEWTDEWNADDGQFPQLVEIALVAAETDSKKTLRRSVLVCIPRLQSGQTDADTEDSSESEENYDSYMNSEFPEVQTEAADSAAGSVNPTAGNVPAGGPPEPLWKRPSMSFPKTIQAMMLSANFGMMIRKTLMISNWAGVRLLWRLRMRAAS